jgi:hypothetical protein
MKYLSLLCFFAWVAVCAVAIGPFKLDPAPQKYQEQTKDHEKKPDTTVPFPNLATSQTDAKETNDHASEGQPKAVRVTEVPPPDAWYKAYVIATVCLLLVAAGGVIAAFWTLRAVKSQAGFMEGQLAAMRDQVKLAIQNALAAQSAAGAAHKNIELVISKERARLRLELLPFEWELFKASNASNIFELWAKLGIAYRVSFHGFTPAFVSGSLILARATKEKEFFSEPAREIGNVMRLPEIISSSTRLDEGRTSPLFSSSALKPLEPGEIEELQSSKLFVHVFGCINYEDAFGFRRQTAFHFRWSQFVEGDVGNGMWVKSGPAEDNRAT